MVLQGDPDRQTFQTQGWTFVAEQYIETPKLTRTRVQHSTIAQLRGLGVCVVLPSSSVAWIKTLAQMSVQDFACNNRVRWKKLTYGRGAFLENLSKCASCKRGRGQACVFLGELYN